jgi:hypothetical protein
MATISARRRAGRICALGVWSFVAACGSSSPSPLSPAADAATSDVGLVDGAATDALAAEGDTADAAGDGAFADEAAAYPAPHPSMPQAISGNGPVMTAPKIVAITFQGDSLQTSIDTFVTQLVGATTYWSGATAEYGVGPLSATAPVHSTDTPAATLADTDVRAWLTAQIQGGAGFPQPDANTLYVLFYPPATSVTAAGGASCHAFNGYHDDFAVTAGEYVSYAVVPRCPPPVASVTVLDELTAEASHEIIEAATDPLPSDQPAYLHVDPSDQGWELLAAGEIGDLCAGFPNAFFKPAGVDNLVQRVWSNAAAAASHDPCEPQGTSPYFNSAPVESDTIRFLGASFKGVRIPVGQSKTVELDLYSDAPTPGPWKVSVLDVSSAFLGSAPALAFTLDADKGQNGDKLNLTIQALATSPLGPAPYWIQNDLGGSTTVWVGVVGN